jgi:cobalt/nickel transport system permease protein
MTLALDFPHCGQSVIGRLDPRWKLAAFMLAALSTALLRTLPPALAAGAATFMLVLAARIPLGWLLARLGGVALALAFFLAWLPFLHHGTESSWQLGWVSLSPDGLALAVLLSVKALTVVALMVTLFTSTPVQDVFKAAHALRVPGVLVHIVLLTFRFIYLIADEFARLRIALRVRGFRTGGNWHSYRTVGQVAGTLLVRSHDRAERVAQAMRCRGFDGCFRSLHEFHTRLVDVAAFGMIVGSAAALVAWDFLAR